MSEEDALQFLRWLPDGWNNLWQGEGGGRHTGFFHQPVDFCLIFRMLDV